MRSLYLLRHAKSDWDGTGIADFDRPLSQRGILAAPKIARFMAENGYIPARILCSAANRTRQTLTAILPHLGDIPDIDIMERIYSGGAQQYFDLVRGQTDTANSILLIGHNPSIQGLALALSGSGDRAMREQMARKYPTTGLSVITFEIDHWSEISESAGHLEVFTTPRMIT
ncbi:MAG: histidine phosphatase family protein [Fimbriimonadaceae bacterium]|nr:histidine phosphatase family protein [Alphaproteobacteria bacterium]